MLTILTGISKFSKGTYKQPLEVLLFETKLYPTHKGTSQYTEESAAQTNEWCLSGIESALKAGFDVCIANSKSEDWNITPYLYLAEKYKQPHRVIDLNQKYGEGIEVPKFMIDQMKTR